MDALPFLAHTQLYKEYADGFLEIAEIATEKLRFFVKFRGARWIFIQPLTLEGVRGNLRRDASSAHQTALWSLRAVLMSGLFFFATPSMRTGLLLRSLRKNSYRLSTLASDVSLPSSNEQREWL